MHCDVEHHAVAVKLLESLGLRSVAATAAEDIASVADRFILTDTGRIELGLKKRGKRSGGDFNLTTWSAVLGLLPEFATAGGKAYLYWMRDKHIMVRFPSQEYLNTLLPYKWHTITEEEEAAGVEWKWLRPQIAGVRLESPNGKKTQQGVIYVPKEEVDVVAEWDLNLNLITRNLI